jgi:hypothetical protein
MRCVVARDECEGQRRAFIYANSGSDDNRVIGRKYIFASRQFRYLEPALQFPSMQNLHWRIAESANDLKVDALDNGHWCSKFIRASGAYPYCVRPSYTS